MASFGALDSCERLPCSWVEHSLGEVDVNDSTSLVRLFRGQGKQKYFGASPLTKGPDSCLIIKENPWRLLIRDSSKPVRDWVKYWLYAIELGLGLEIEYEMDREVITVLVQYCLVPLQCTKEIALCEYLVKLPSNSPPVNLSTIS